MFELKPVSREAIPAALEKANRYRLLNEPSAAESICLDILKIEPDNQEALVTIVLAMSDRSAMDYAVGNSQIQEYLSRIADEYEQTYYTGIIYERRAKAVLCSGSPGSSSNAYEYFIQAMNWFEKAEAIRPPKNDDAVLRWNGCARIIIHNKLARREMEHDFLE
jgi:tetratricopeptide (TPR) repeat protein